MMKCVSVYKISNSWEQRKLEDCAFYRRGSFPQPYGKKEWYDGDEAMPFVQVADVTDTMNLVEDTKQKISKIAQKMSVFAEKNSVLVTLQGSIGRVAITQYGAFVDRTVLIFEKYKVQTDELFWAYTIKEKFIDEARKAPGGTIKTITKESLSNFELNLANFSEQQKIGAFFSNLDNLITLHQRKFYWLKKKKNAKNKISTNSWEQRKYKDLGDPSSGGNLNYDCLDENGEYKCVLYGELYTRYDCVIKDVFYRTNKKGNTIFKNDILFPQSTTVDALSLISPACLNDETAETSGVFVIRPQKEIDGNFVSYYTKGNPNQRSKLSKKAQGLTIVHLYYQSIKDEQICIPSYSEQKQISSLFLKLDNLITLHQRK
ncbi:MAG: restriction endonuclease subunit S [Alphaproteobacteria bacterium]|nr:restriction endonuclease subunit S [Alphaproteobacteria bacterium]